MVCCMNNKTGTFNKKPFKTDAKIENEISDFGVVTEHLRYNI